MQHEKKKTNSRNGCQLFRNTDEFLMRLPGYSAWHCILNSSASFNPDLFSAPLI